MIKPELGFVLLFVESPIKSARFYSELLDLKPLELSPTFVLFSLSNGVQLGLWSRYTAEPTVSVYAGASEICFSSNDIDELYKAWGEKGITVAQKPIDLDFGRTICCA